MLRLKSLARGAALLCKCAWARLTQAWVELKRNFIIFIKLIILLFWALFAVVVVFVVSYTEKQNKIFLFLSLPPLSQTRSYLTNFDSSELDSLLFVH